MLEIPWAERATLWRRRAPSDVRDPELMLEGSLRDIVRKAAKVKTRDRRLLRIVLPDRTAWPFGYSRRLQINELIEQEQKPVEPADT